jgi:hypothetical protein
MLPESPNNSLSKNYCLNRYYHFLSSYQARYTYRFPFVVTWQAISFWRYHTHIWGLHLIKNGWLQKEQFLKDKSFRFGETELISLVQQATALTKKEIV